MSQDFASRRTLLVTGLAAGAIAACAPAAGSQEQARLAPAPALQVPESEPGRTAVFAGGCFWGIEGVFQHVRGVSSARSGYAGGRVENPTYEQVTSGRTGHAEAVEVVYDPRIVSYGALLRIFFSVAHDPTQLNRQGPDIGTQYRSAIFTLTDAQARVARAYVAQLTAARAYARPIVTQIEPLRTFYAAETYHQDYLTRNPNQPYIVAHDLPKIANLRRLFPAVFVARPAP